MYIKEISMWGNRMPNKIAGIIQSRITYALMERPSVKVPHDQARESLIAIAYSSPEESKPFDISPGNKVIVSSKKGVNPAAGDEAERLRSELISISYIQSPDAALCP
ncbi:PREDICTED: uncharacterized protein LOC104807966 [Tarenaya hassleriana]|uniref:uncharacterized protein LOC104807966 n=1 Tax=Tarenaya hassleriana TaxID=28532 RepID=UPI00053C5849|nr:PREDICTED: uncharacterized protein LOC104807966 [Tarenaya hassleriana]